MIKVLKFGGSSIVDMERVQTIKALLQSEKDAIIVISAFKGVTDHLIRISLLASQKNEEYTQELSILIKQHFDLLHTLVEPTKEAELSNKLMPLVNELGDILKGVFLVNELSCKTQAKILSFGERASSLIISCILGDVTLMDSQEFIVTDSNYCSAKIDFDQTNSLIEKKFKNFKGLAVVPGFVARDLKGEVTTLGRGGSDYTASVIAAALNAEVLEIWTNVDGFMNADPRFVEKASPIDELTYAEAIELSHFGAKVIYTPTIQPVYHKNIPIHIRNTFNPAAKGTWIKKNANSENHALIKGISSINDINLITLLGTGMVGVPGTAMRLFGALARAKVNVILITQASSEHSITFAIVPQDSDKAIESIHAEFKNEIFDRKEINILIEYDLSVIAIVGEKMKNTPGISANLFRSLGKSGISAVALAQGSSELNISVAIKKDSLKKALSVIHEGFFLSTFKELHLFLVGTGTVGGQLLAQIQQQHALLMEKHKLKINVCGIINVDGAYFDENGIPLMNYAGLIKEKGEKINIDLFTQKIIEMNLPNGVFIDCTASAEVSAQYLKLLDNFVSVVTANKIANSSDYQLYKELREVAMRRSVKFLYEANVGAGLPIINTINDLVMSGDRIVKIEAVLSGTLNFIFNTLSAEIPLSKTIQLAKEKGYSEPDPRIDLSGVDVVRKLLILSREWGYEFEKKDVEVNTFLPADCFEGSIDNFWSKVKEHDAAFEENRKKIAAEGKKWRFIACLENGKPFVQLMTVDINHPAYNLEGSNNIILFTTERYKELPMVIKGYGAGAEVTAAGVFADVIRCANK